MLNIITIILIISTMLTVIAGVSIMIIGGKINKKYGNKLMVVRISCQATAILLLFILFKIT